MFERLQLKGADQGALAEDQPDLLRAKVPGGWLLLLDLRSYAGGPFPTHTTKSGVAFYPDPDHKWDGNSLP